MKTTSPQKKKGLEKPEESKAVAEAHPKPQRRGDERALPKTKKLNMIIFSPKTPTQNVKNIES